MWLLKMLWASPNTALGLVGVLMALLTGGQARIVRGVVEAHGGWVTRALGWDNPWMQSSILAITFGHVVLGASAAALDFSREHERVHVRQYERWGPLFLPAYAACSLWCLLRGQHVYRQNWFEREAYDADRARMRRPPGSTDDQPRG